MKNRAFEIGKELHADISQSHFKSEMSSLDEEQ